ncbi:MAG: hypothetical protein QOI55_780, partial [Actinomycetota bacterium]|nr:hypothetical protein [Actinomycetota bacterium]
YHIQDHLPLRETTARDRTVGEVLDMLVDPKSKKNQRTKATKATKSVKVTRKTSSRVGDGRAAAKPRARRA